MLELLNTWLLDQGVNEGLVFYFVRGVAIVAVLLLSLVVNFVAKRYIVSSLTYVISKSKSKWDDAVLRQRTLNRIAHLAPAVVIYHQGCLADLHDNYHDACAGFVTEYG